MTPHYILSTGLYFLLCASSHSESLSFAKSGPFDYAADISEAILKEAYGRLNIDISTTTLPSERALWSANAGILDGDINRIIGLDRQYPNLIRVVVPINAIEGMVFSKNENLKIDTWEDLKPFSIVLRRGAKFAEHGTQGMDVSAVLTNDLVFKMLYGGRTEVAVSTRIEGMLTSKRLGFDSIKPTEPALVNFNLYHYVHKKNRALIPELTAVLTTMKEEGLIRRIKDDALKVLRQ